MTGGEQPEAKQKTMAGGKVVKSGDKIPGNGSDFNSKTPAVALECFRGSKRSYEEDAGGQQDERYTKALRLSAQTEDDDEENPWDEDLHRSIVAAIFEIGLSHSSPAVISENMKCQSEAITGERMKSHLQKFRKGHVKEKHKFLQEYDSFLQTTLNVAALAPASAHRIINMGQILGGKVAALLSYAIMREDAQNEDKSRKQKLSGQNFQFGMNKVDFPAAPVPFPELTENEKKTPLGVSLVFSMGLFKKMNEYLVQRRAGTLPVGLAVSDQSALQHILTAQAPPQGDKPLLRSIVDHKSGTLSHSQKREPPVDAERPQNRSPPSHALDKNYSTLQGTPLLPSSPVRLAPYRPVLTAPDHQIQKMATAQCQSPRAYSPTFTPLSITASLLPPAQQILNTTTAQQMQQPVARSLYSQANSSVAGYGADIGRLQPSIHQTLNQQNSSFRHSPRTIYGLSQQELTMYQTTTDPNRSPDLGIPDGSTYQFQNSFSLPSEAASFALGGPMRSRQQMEGVPQDFLYQPAQAQILEEASFSGCQPRRGQQSGGDSLALNVFGDFGDFLADEDFFFL
jgi:SHAQKYF class myb-like DNA-binding protein